MKFVGTYLGIISCDKFIRSFLIEISSILVDFLKI